MHLSGLDRFLAVVKVGSLNKAAEMLHISQPALTKSIQGLEERLGAELFVREVRGVSLTPYGKAVLLHARLIDAEMRKIAEDVEALHDLTAGSVNVGGPPGAGFHTSIFPAATLRLIAGDRRLSVNYTMGTRDQLLPLLRQGGLDLMVGVLVEDETTGDLVQQALFEDRNCIVVRASHPLLAQQPAELESLLAHPWFVMTESIALERGLRQQAHARGLRPERSIVRSDSSQLLKHAVLASDGIGLTRYDVSRADIRDGTLHEVRLETGIDALGRHTMGLIHRREAQLSPAARELVAAIEAECRQHA